MTHNKLSESSRQGSVVRKTGETDISVTVRIDGSGKAKVSTGIGFLDHMLDQIARHGLFDLDVSVRGDLHIDAHHTVEDTGLAFGEALREALGNRAGLVRYGHAYVPLDEALSRVVIDLSNRPYLVWNVRFTVDRIGEQMETELFREFFQAFAQKAGVTLHVESLYAENNHHRIESIFKAFARALRTACTLDDRTAGAIPSTKGVL